MGHDYFPPRNVCSENWICVLTKDDWWERQRLIHSLRTKNVWLVRNLFFFKEEMVLVRCSGLVSLILNDVNVNCLTSWLVSKLLASLLPPFFDPRMANLLQRHFYLSIYLRKNTLWNSSRGWFRPEWRVISSLRSLTRLVSCNTNHSKSEFHFFFLNIFLLFPGESHPFKCVLI